MRSLTGKTCGPVCRTMPAVNASPVWSRSQARWRASDAVTVTAALIFDPDQLPAGCLDKQVRFPAPLLFAHVVQARAVAARGEFRAQLGSEERVEETAQHVGAVQDGVPAESEHGRDERRVDQVALGGP
jgi:hypothetical protein